MATRTPRRIATPAQPPRNRQPLSPTRKKPTSRNSRLRNLALAVLLLALIALASLAGALTGYASGTRERQDRLAQQGSADLQQQFELGVQDLQAGRYDFARQRFEFVLRQDPAYAGAAERLAQAMAVLNATATPTPVPATPTPTPTRDLRPVQDLFSQAQALLANSDWGAAIDTLNALRGADPAFQVAKVDGMLYLALRSRGVQNILENNNLEAGSYDLALAERFAPLDVEAARARELARLYMYGSAFWEAYPEQAVFYFSQVAAAAPYLRDASGWTAMERYRGALVQYGDQFAAAEDWCSAQAQYELALQVRADAALQATSEEAALKCSPPTETAEPSATPTITPTLGITSTATFEFPTQTDTPAPSETPTLEPPATSETPQPATETATTPIPPSETPEPPTATPQAIATTPVDEGPPPIATQPSPEETASPLETSQPAPNAGTSSRSPVAALLAMVRGFWRLL